MKNVKIKIIEAKDALNVRIPQKYKGSLDWGQEVDYILNTEEVKDIIRIEKDEYYSDAIVTVTFNYIWNACILTEEENERIENLNIVLNMCVNNEEKRHVKDKINDIVFNSNTKFNCEARVEEMVNGLIKDDVKKLSDYKNRRDVKRKKLEKEFKEKNNTYCQIKNLNNMKNRSKKGKGTFTEDDEANLGELKKSYKIDFNNYLNKNEEYQEVINKINDIKRKKESALSDINKQYILKTDELRVKLYQEGFYIGNEHFVRYKRSSGSARVGKVLFINEKYYKHMIDWSFAGIDINNKEIDIAGIEAYISLPLSSAINKFKLKPENILLVNDVKSTFKDKVYATEYINEKLETSEKEIEIENNIFDGEALLDESVFLDLMYDDKADLQLRNRFYKGTGIRCRIQDFFTKNNITKISELNGVTIAKDIKDIKLITTPSSVKYLKFIEGTIEEKLKKWLEIMTEDWYVCKYEKPQHHLHQMVQTHYQLLNSLGINKEEFEEFLKPTISYIDKLKNNDDVFLKHIKIKCDGEMDEGDNYILSMLKWNKNFIDSAVVKEFRKDSYESYIKNARKGHILVNGNYSIVANNVLEMLYHSIGKLKEVVIDGNKVLRIHGQDKIKLEGYEVISNKFKDGLEILSVRSPQPTMSNVAVYKNINNQDNLYYNFLKKYFYLSKEVIYTNSINVNRMEKMSSEDNDGDSELLTDNKILVEHAKKLQDRFLVNNDMTPKTPELLEYNPNNLATTDIKCSKNKIGEIINLAQVLNTVYWSNVDEKSDKWLEDLFRNICTLNALSCIEIDRCKKVSPVKSSLEIKRIKDLNYIKSHKVNKANEVIEECYKLTKEDKERGYRLVKEKPNFLKYCNKFKLGGQSVKTDENEGNVLYKNYNVGMDLLESILTERISAMVTKRTPRISLVEMLHKGSTDKKKENRRQIKFITDILDERISNIKQTWATGEDKEAKLNEENDIILETVEDIKKKISPQNIARIIYKCERYLKSKEDIEKAEKLLKKEDITFEDKEKCIKKIADCQEFIAKHEIYKNYRNIVKILFKTNKAMFLSIFETFVNDKVLVRAKEKCDDSITLYDTDYIIKNIEYNEKIS